MKRAPAWLIACGILALAMLTNRWMSWQAGIDFLSAGDVPDGYLPVAHAAPGWPLEPLSFHHAQRFFWPYALGTLSWLTGAGLPALFTAAMAVVQACFLVLLWKLLGRLELSRNARLLVWCLYLFQPYSLRYYWIVPGMLADVAFELGTLVLLLGLFSRRASLLWAGLLLAAISRQTALMLVPGLLAWVLWAGERAKRRRWPLAIGLTLAELAVYEGTGLVAARFAKPSVNADHLLGIFSWAASPDFSARALAEHTLRCLLPFLPALALLLGGRPSRWPKETWYCLLMAAAVAAQPFLAGPEFTGQNAARLVTLGFLPLVVAWALSIRSEWPAWLGVVLFLGSFHHLYTWIGPSGPLGTAALQLGVAVIALGAAFLVRNREGVAR